MKVVFLEEVEGTARIGEVKEVKNGFARNYLLPRGLAAPATPALIKRAEARAEREARRQMALDEEAQAVVALLEGKSVTITARVGAQGKLYGSITAGDIAEEVAKLLKVEEFDRHKLVLEEPIREVGIHSVPLRLTRNVETAIDVEVVGEGAPVEEPSAEGGEEQPVEAEEEPSAEAEEETAAEAEEEPSAEVEEEEPAAEAEEQEEKPAQEGEETEEETQQ
jgi:large subunit ribosomal protein L9